MPRSLYRKRSRRRSYRNKPLSAATKRKISAALKRRNRTTAKRTTTRRKVTPKTRTRTKTVVKYRSRRAPARRRSTRRSLRSRIGKINFRTLFTKDVVQTAGGAVGVTMLSNFVLMNFGARLPGVQSRIGLAAWRTGIGLGGAIVVNRVVKNRKIAEGMVIGTAVMLINDILAYAMSGMGMIGNGGNGNGGNGNGAAEGATEGASAYLGRGPRRISGSGAYFPSARRTSGAKSYTPGYSGSNSFGALYGSDSAFANSAWD